MSTAVRKDWFVISEKMNNPNEVISHFKLSEEELDTLIRDLKGSVMEGVFEYKRTSITAMLRPLESLQHNSKAMEHLHEAVTKGRALLVVTLIQRLFCMKKVQFPTPKKQKKDTHAAPHEQEKQSAKISIKDILTFVQQKVRSNPEKMKDPEIKKILMYTKMYQNEVKKMQDLARKIPEEKKRSLKENFRTSLRELQSKITASYHLLQDKEELILQSIPPAQHFDRRDYTPLAPVLKQQSQIFSQILSTLIFAGKEKFHTREVLVGIALRQGEFTGLVDKEQKKFGEINPFDKKGLAADKELTAELLKFFQKEREFLKLHPWN